MIKIFNDLHADTSLIDEIKALKVDPGDILIANGDIFGSRGPILNEIVKIFYEVRRGSMPKTVLEKIFARILCEPVIIEDSLIKNAAHSGTFLAEMCCRDYSCVDFRSIVESEARDNLAELRDIANHFSQQGGQLIYLPGNGEIAISDFDVSSGVETEVTLPPKKRLFNRLSEQGVFRGYGVSYANTPRIINGDTLLLPIDAIDDWLNGARPSFTNCGITTIITHYPPKNSDIEDCFYKLFGYKNGDMDILRQEAVSSILEQLPEVKNVIFGHIHPAITPELVASLPKVIVFKESEHQLIWNCPGNVFAFN